MSPMRRSLRSINTFARHIFTAELLDEKKKYEDISVSEELRGEEIGDSQVYTVSKGYLMSQNPFNTLSVHHRAIYSGRWSCRRALLAALESSGNENREAMLQSPVRRLRVSSRSAAADLLCQHTYVVSSREI